MGNKLITNLTLRSNVSDDLNFSSEDGSQSYRVTGLQIKDYVQQYMNRSTVPTTSKTSNYTTEADDYFIACDASGTGFGLIVTLDNDAAEIGQKYLIKKTDSSTKPVAIDTTNSKLIDGFSQIALSFVNQSVELLWNGSRWEIIQANYSGEVIQSYNTNSAGVPSTGAWGDVTTIFVPAGRWLVGATVSAQRQSGSTFTSFNAGIGTASGTSTSGLTLGDSYQVVSATSDDNKSITIAPKLYTFSSPTSLYLKVNAIYTASNMSFSGRINGVRISF